MNQPYEGATEEQLQHHLVQELLRIHNYFRNQLAAMLSHIDDLMNGKEQLSSAETTIRTRTLLRSALQYTHFLHTHHHIETTNLFPALEQEGLDAGVINRLNADHDELSVLIDTFSLAVRDLSAVDPDVMNNDMRRLADALRDHLAYEETHICPLLAHWTHFPTQQ